MDLEKASEELLKAMATIMKVNGRMTKKMVLENILIVTVQIYMNKDIGKTTRKKVNLQ